PTQLTTTEITVKIRKGKEQRLREKLEAIREGNRHTFTGSIARYIMIDLQKPDQLVIWLILKDTETPSEFAYEEEMKAFMFELEDVVDWRTLEIFTREGLIYT